MYLKKKLVMQLKLQNYPTFSLHQPPHHPSINSSFTWSIQILVFPHLITYIIPAIRNMKLATIAKAKN